MAKTKGIFHFLNIIGRLIDYRIMYTNIKKDPDLKPVSKYFGGKSILFSILFAVFTAFGTFLTITGFTKNLAVIFNIFAIALGIGLLLCALEFFFYALSCTIKQIALNRRFISWLALIIFIAATAISALAIFAALQPLHL